MLAYVAYGIAVAVSVLVLSALAYVLRLSIQTYL